MVEKKQETKSTDTSKDVRELEIHYLKSAFHRVIHVDGMHGGIAPAGKALAIAVYSERVPIPKKEVYELDKVGRKQETIAVESKLGIVREIEVSLIVDIGTARAIQTWLVDKIAELEKVQEHMETVRGEIK